MPHSSFTHSGPAAYTRAFSPVGLNLMSGILADFVGLLSLSASGDKFSTFTHGIISIRLLKSETK